MTKAVNNIKYKIIVFSNIVSNMVKNLVKNILAKIPKVSNIINTKIALESNLLLDVLIKFIILALFIYLLYKYFLIDMTLSYILKQIDIHLSMYSINYADYINKIYNFMSLPIEQSIIQNNIDKSINNELNNQMDYLNNLPSSKDSSTNDKNFAIILAVCLVVIPLIIIAIIIFTGGYKQINYNNIVYNLLLNVIVLVVTQLVFFYMVYSYFDPIKVYKFFYYDILSQTPVSTNTIPNIPNIPNIPLVVPITTSNIP